DRRRLNWCVGDDHGAVGVAAAHHAAVDAEVHHLAPVEHGPAREYLRGELHSLPADPGDHHLAFHGPLPGYATGSRRAGDRPATHPRRRPTIPPAMPSTVNHMPMPNARPVRIGSSGPPTNDPIAPPAISMPTRLSVRNSFTRK